MIPALDFETYSDAGFVYDDQCGYYISVMGKGKKAGLPIINAAVYAEHHSTRIISLAFNLCDGCGTRLWTPPYEAPQALFNYLSTGAPIEAHNSLFEFFVWYYVCHNRLGWPDLPLHQLRDSAALASAWGLPASLGQLSDILDPDQKKDKRGGQLIRLLSVPKKPTKKEPYLVRTFETHPDLYCEMYDYNIQDVESEQDISRRLPPLTPTESEVWAMDQRINVRGIQVDTDGLNACLSLFEQAEQRYTQELQKITGGQVNSVGEVTKRSAGDMWLQSQGVNLLSLDKEHVKAALAGDLPPVARRVLEIRQIIGGASIKKLYAMKRLLNSDGRIRGMFKYCGANRTGRWSGSGVQPQNLKNHGPSINGMEWGNTLAKEALQDIHTGDLDMVQDKWGSAVDLIGSCMRSLLIAAPGHDLICSDYSAIEAVGAAALSGEEWRLEVFRTHGKIYEASASMAFGVPLDEILNHKATTGKHHPLRKKGKVRELAGGYGGWIGAWRNFGADGSDDEIKADVLSWRKESPAIVEMWGDQYRQTEPGRWNWKPDLYGIEGKVVSAISYPNTYHEYRSIGFGYNQTDDVLYIRLPSGRDLCYHQPRLTHTTDRRGLPVYQISYMGVNNDPDKPKIWTRIITWGSRIFENIVQAVCRDIMAAAMLRLESAGYPVVLHVHDECAAEVPYGVGSVEEFETVMGRRETWYRDWPIKAAGGWRGLRFRK